MIREALPRAGGGGGAGTVFSDKRGTGLRGRPCSNNKPDRATRSHLARCYRLRQRCRTMNVPSLPSSHIAAAALAVIAFGGVLALSPASAEIAAIASRQRAEK